MGNCYWIKIILLLTVVSMNSGCAFFNLSLGPKVSPLEEKVLSGKKDNTLYQTIQYGNPDLFRMRRDRLPISY